MRGARDGALARIIRENDAISRRPAPSVGIMKNSAGRLFARPSLPNGFWLPRAPLFSSWISWLNAAGRGKDSPSYGAVILNASVAVTHLLKIGSVSQGIFQDAPISFMSLGTQRLAF